MRLDYFLAHSTGLSRKQAKVLIGRGEVQVEGEDLVVMREDDVMAVIEG